jgi:hypothetical protein
MASHHRDDPDRVLTDHEPRRCGGCGQQFRRGTFRRGGFTPCGCDGAVGGGHITVYCRACDWSTLVGHEGPAPEPERMPQFGRDR